MKGVAFTVSPGKFKMTFDDPALGVPATTPSAETMGTAESILALAVGSMPVASLAVATSAALSPAFA
jgi:hypothetical protein